ncbi:titin homolog [Drosophila montana]|uniref:titin homolog n=1 Tax=Drosophila montana TaxID=40370 RepID=UPI00313B7AD9
MDARGSYWYLEHVSTGKKLILQSGDNSVGRHSCCKIVLKEYDFLSRQHAKFIVNSENIVILEQLNALNGVFINESKLEVNTQQLNCGDRIGLGVQIETPHDVVPPNYAIFQLKKTCPNEEDIVVISDDEDNDQTPTRPTEMAKEGNKEDPELKNGEVSNKDNAADKSPIKPTSHRSIHLPKLPEMKQELLSQATKEIENIFGEPDEDLLESVFQINPYVYKQLNNNNIATTGEKIRDGDVIELPEEVNQTGEDLPEKEAENPVMSPPPPPPPPLSPGEDQIVIGDYQDDYDENFAMSQAVLREMKEEMAGGSADLSDADPDDLHDEEFLPPASWIKSEIATQIDDDEIILIEDEDDELYSKVADWSSKLLTQNLMSQVYPLDDGKNVEGQANDPIPDDDDDSQLSENIFMSRKSKALRIDSSSSEDELSALLSVNSSTPQKPKMRRCSVRLKSIDMSQRHQNSTDNLANSPLAVVEDNRQELEVVLVPSVQHAAASAKAAKKTSTPRKRNKTVSERSQLKELPTKPEATEPLPEAKEPTKKRSSRLRNRSKSCYLESPLSSPTRPQKTGTVEKKQAKDLPSKITKPETKTPAETSNSRIRTRSKSYYMESPLSSPTRPQKNSTVADKQVEDLPAEIPEPETETPTKKRSSRMRNRSKSCYMESPLPSPTRPKHSETVGDNQLEDLPAEIPEQETETPAKNSSSSMRNRSKSCYMESPLGSPTRPKRDKQLEVPAEMPAPELKTPTNRVSPRLQNRSKSCYMESPMPSPPQIPNITNTEKERELPAKSAPGPETPIKKCSPRLLSRSKSCYVEGPMSSPKTQNADKKKEVPTKPDEIIPAPVQVTPIKKALSARLLNRSKSCYMERPVPSPANSEDATSITKSVSTENSRGPEVIAAPHLPKNRGKLRGVSAASKENERRNQILERQRSVEYQAEMKAKWYQKPKDKKRECEQIKEKRREQLKKIADKPKQDAASDRADERKRKPTSVPTLGNSNRGEFLTKGVQPPTAKKPKLDKAQAKPEKPTHKRRATIESFSQQLNAADLVKSPPTHYSRPPERKEAERARNKRTCNRVTFADMDREFDLRQEREKRAKSNRHVRFNDNIQIKIIERVEGAYRKVAGVKDTKKVTLSTYAERRAWSQAQGRLENFTDLIMGNIINWGNQWLALRSADAVAESEVLIPIPNEFKSYKQYRDIIIPLMKLELISTIERDYKISKSTFEVNLYNISNANSRNRPRFVLNTRYNQKLGKRFDLYTISCDKKLKETFASIARIQRIAGNNCEICFEILQENISLDVLNSCQTLTVRPVVDNIRVEMGAFNAIYLLGRSPLFQRILQPSENVLSYDNRLLQPAAYKGFKRLNNHQMDICQRTWSRLIDDSTPSITLIQGPPGTGKSVVISNLTLQCMYGSSNHTLDRKILICAHSNAAVDNITLYLKRARQAMSHSQFELVRFGFFEKMDPNVRDVSLDAYLGKKLAEKRKRLSAEHIEALTMQQQQLETEIAELKKLPAQINYMQQQLNSKERQLRLIIEQLKPPLTPREEHEFSMACLQRANIVCTTLSSCVKLAAFIDYFDACIIDEATQCTEPWTLLPLRFGVRGLVLVGDTQQLPATVLSQKAIDFGLGNSMFDRIQRNLKQQLEKPRGNHFVHTKVFKLSMQYRMHPEICRWPNSYFYDNQLVNATCTERLISPFIPYCVINLSYTRDTNDTSSRSISNDEEARFVAKLLIEMDKLMPAKRFSYGLITPYSNHCYTLSQVIPGHMKITPQTVDAYQGQERDIVILSNARTRGVGFLTNYQRLNVAITRPQRCLVICGNFDDLQSVKIWRHLLDDARKRGVYFDLERSDVEDLPRSLIGKMLVKPIEIVDDTAPPSN